MQSFKAAATTTNPDMFCHSSFFLRGDDCNSRHQARFPDLGELDHPAVAFHHDDAVDLSPSSIFSLKSSNVGVVASNLHYGALNTNIGATEIVSSGTGCLDTEQFMYQKGATFGASLGNGHIENWADSGLADTSQQTDTSTDVDTDHKTRLSGLQHGPIIVDLVDQSKSNCGDQKTLRRLAQNREAARKSRLRKKAYVQQLESSRVRLTELEKELQRVRQHGAFITTGLSGDHGHSVIGNAALAFDMEYGRWLDEHQRLINDLRSAMYFTCSLVCGKRLQRGFMWLGGFRSSELLKILGNHLEPLTDQQLVGICNLQQSSQQAEDALSQGMEALQQSLVDTLSSACLGPTASGNVADYMGQMAIAMGKLATLENFLHQADLLRQQTLQQMHRILTTRQAAQALLVISDYTCRLRALGSLWLARPRS
ncbi:Transcription factor PERIANTHIA [Hibiscus syriacus]|uniref:Transcription factor PERIANTHIA n=1 Tax=Hibiscus syriacus TaxID=106335 RepID=A0A6A2WNW7_HIBSY|nr:Transcription factor PERIANTHIA [Hibiscus syriacus]